jgi:hypothetical protein
VVRLDGEKVLLDSRGDLHGWWPRSTVAGLIASANGLQPPHTRP